MSIPLELDASVPVLAIKLSRNAVQHGTLGIIRSLGRLGVRVYMVVEDGFVPAAMSRYLTGAFLWKAGSLDAKSILGRLRAISKRLSRPTILVPTDDLAAIFIAENAEALKSWFLFPQLARDLPGRLANKKDLDFLCRSAGVPCPRAEFPSSMHEVGMFLKRATFPVVVKPAESRQVPKNANGVSVVHTAEQLLAIYHRTESSEHSNLILQEYIPECHAEDWVFHAYCNPRTDCFVAFTGRKLRSYPPYAGSTTLGVPLLNQRLSEQTETFLRAIGYSGIVDLDYRLDKRDGQYKLLDFNPRIGANFRMFENHAGVDVVRALHLDLTGRRVLCSPPIEGRKFVVEPYDVLAGIGYRRRDGLTARAWWQSLQGKRETAWFHWDDPVPFLGMCIRMLFRGASRAIRAGRMRLHVRSSKPEARLVLETKPDPIRDP
jgi:predicted ATP-grasp superfamily ATP-dependent carboligase